MYAVITDKDGNKVESMLHEALVGAFKNYDEANRYYNAITSDEFKNTDLYKSLEFDEYGEPTFESLYKAGLYNVVSKSKIATFKEKGLNAQRVPHGANDGTIELFRKAVEFNSKEENDDFIAIVLYDDVSKEHYLKVMPRNTLYEDSSKERIRSIYDALTKVKEMIDNTNSNLMKQIFIEVTKNAGFLDIPNLESLKNYDGQESITLLFNMISDLTGENNRGSAPNLHDLSDPAYSSVLAKAIIEAYLNTEGSLNSIATRLINACDDKINSDARVLYSEGGIGYDLSPDEVAEEAIAMMFRGEKTGVNGIDNIIDIIKINLSRIAKKIASNNEYDVVIKRIKLSKKNFDQPKSLSKEEADRIKANTRQIKEFAKKANSQVNEMQKYMDRLNEVFRNIQILEERRMVLVKEIKPKKDDKEGIEKRKALFKHQKKLLEMLDSSKTKGKVASGIYWYTKEVAERVDELFDKLGRLDGVSVSIKDKAKALNEANELIQSYKKIIVDIQDVINDTKGGFVAKMEQELKKALSDSIESCILMYRISTNENDDDKDEIIEDIRSAVDSFSLDDNIDSVIEEINKFIEKYKGTPNYRSQGMYEAKLLDIENVMHIVELLKAAKLTDNVSQKIKGLTEFLDEATANISKLDGRFKKMARPVFASFLEEFQEDSARKVKFGEYMGFKKGEEISIEKILERIDSDVNYYQRLFSSLANAPDMILGLADKAIKSIKEEARMDLMEDVENIKREAKLLEEAGIYDTSWMFEVDDKGNKTGYYVTSSLKQNAIDMLLKEDEVIKRLNLIPGENPNLNNLSKDDRIWFSKKLKALIKRMDENKKENKQYSDIMANPAKKRFYEFFMKTYGRLQGYYPPSSTKPNRIIGIRKDNMETIMNTEGVQNKVHEVWELYLDQFRDTNDDEISGVRLDLQGNELKRLPIYFCNFKQDEVNMQSEDCVSNILCYAAKAHEYSKLNEFIDFLEIGREVLKTRQIAKRAAGHKVFEKLDKMSKSLRKEDAKNKENGVENDKDQIYDDDNGHSNIYAMYEAALNMRIYGKPRKDEGTFGNTRISKGKVANWINKRTAEGALAFSLANGVSNVMTGRVMMNIEKYCNQFFSAKDTVWADVTYGKEVLSYLAEKASRIKSSKLSLFGELFDVQYEYLEDVNSTRWNKTNWASRLVTSGVVTQVMQNAGEHWMAFRTALSLAHNTFLIDKNGNKVNIWDAFEVKYFDKEGNLVDSNMGYGAKLKIKEGMKTDSGIALDNSEEGKKALSKLIFDFHRKVGGINHGMHGIYNTEDANAIQQYAIGRLAYMFRKWIPAAIHKRFGSVQYDYDIQGWTEGYYMTCFRICGQLIKELKEFKKIQLRWSELEDEEKANIKRALVEISSFIAVSLFCYLKYSKNGGDDDKDKDKSWIYNFIKYQAFRLKSELGALVPWIEMPKEAIRIFKSPAAGLNLADNSLDILYALNPQNWGLLVDEEDDSWLIKRGIWKDHSKGFKYLFGNKLIFPKINVIINNVGISEKIGFYMNN